MGSSIDKNDSYGLKYGNENEYKFKRLNIYIYDNKENKKKYEIIEEEFQNSEYKLSFFYKTDLNNIIKEIENKFDDKLSLQNSYNIILKILKEDNNIEKEKEPFLKYLEGEYSSIRPTIILSKKIKNENEKEQANNNNTFNKKNQKNIYQEKIEEEHLSANLGNSDISNEYIELVYYKNDKNFAEIIEKIKQLYCYYNNIGDIYTIINYQLGQHVDYDENGVKYPYKPTLNILVIGRSGGGKSTLINLLLNEKKALTGSKLSGLSKTQLFSRYIHQEYPITFIDTPGIEIEEDFKNMKDYLSETKKLFKDGKNKIHTILYIINSSEPLISLILFSTTEISSQLF
jgi:predicted GTPase